MSSSEGKRARHYKHLFLWVAQSWLAMFYLGAGYAKITQPRDLLTALMTWPGQVNLDLVQAIGWIEVALAVGLVAPLLSWPKLRDLLLMSAAALMLYASCMAGYHAAQKDLALSIVNGFLTVLAVAVLAGRSARREGGSPL